VNPAARIQAVTEPEVSELDYLREVERLARDVVTAAGNEGWLDTPDGGEAGPRIQRAIEALSRRLHHWHYPGDGCLEDRPTVRLAGAGLLTPTRLADEDAYAQACQRLGVEARQEGWGLWHTWAENDRPVTMVVTCVDTTQGVLANWARGIKTDPVSPLPAQIALVHTGWTQPMILSPRSTRRLGVDGRP
jgi:hypothetical protein